MINYRKDLDALRALAVLLVILFHAQIPFFSGGFIGVDIFFVISGFLITGIIVTQIDNNQFSFRDFYERRLRRIYPALLLMVFIVSFFVTSQEHALMILLRFAILHAVLCFIIPIFIFIKQQIISTHPLFYRYFCILGL